MPIDMFPRTIENRLKIGRYVQILRHQSACIEPCGSRVLSTSGEFVEVLNFREDNEESSEETTGCKASVYAEFDECTRSENFIEILRFRHFARYMSFTPTGKQGKKKQIMNGIKVSVVLHLV